MREGSDQTRTMSDWPNVGGFADDIPTKPLIIKIEIYNTFLCVAGGRPQPESLGNLVSLSRLAHQRQQSPDAPRSRVTLQFATVFVLSTIVHATCGIPTGSCRDGFFINDYGQMDIYFQGCR